jgi:hypothetical protein
VRPVHGLEQTAGMAMNLTTGQKKVLYQAGNFGARKRDTLSKYWRNFDQLERRGFIKRGHGGLYMLTDAGATAWDRSFAAQPTQT